jgi:hypothetical protein
MKRIGDVLDVGTPASGISFGVVHVLNLDACGLLRYAERAILYAEYAVLSKAQSCKRCSAPFDKALTLIRHCFVRWMCQCTRAW